MSQLPRVVCSGAPRDLGLDQGRFFRDEIRRVLASHRASALARLRFALAPPAAARAALRETRRFFPHMAERTAGLARGAGVSPLALALLSALPEPRLDDALRIVATGRGPGIARAILSSALVVLRESAPDSDYRSLEFVEAARIAPWVGVNEHGLAVGVSAMAAGLRAESDCAAPAALLAQDCLQRFDRVEKALEWIERRPAGGSARIALADASGASALIEVDGASRKRIESAESPLATSTAVRSWVVVADPTTRALGWTYADGRTGEAGLGSTGDVRTSR